MAKIDAKNHELVKGNNAATEEKIFDTRKVVNTLERLMTDVTQSEITPATVQAACLCADKITDILRLHLDVERLRTKMNPRLNGG